MTVLINYMIFRPIMIYSHSIIVAIIYFTMSKIKEDKHNAELQRADPGTNDKG